MYYYKIKKNSIIKYKVILDNETLIKIRQEIIEKCSHITHEKYETTKRPNKLDTDHIKNYKETKVNEITFKNYKTEEYLVEYDYYHHPKLILYIDSLLKGNTNIIEKIKKEQHNIQSQKIQIIPLDKLTKQHINLLLNQKQVPITTYIESVLNCITLHKVSELPLDKALEVLTFLKESKENTRENKLNDIIKLEKRKK